MRILDVRQPGQALLELRGHGGPVNNIEWSPTRRGMLASGGDDALVLVWDLLHSSNGAALNGDVGGGGGSSGSNPLSVGGGGGGTHSRQLSGTGLGVGMGLGMGIGTGSAASVGAGPGLGSGTAGGIGTGTGTGAGSGTGGGTGVSGGAGSGTGAGAGAAGSGSGSGSSTTASINAKGPAVSWRCEYEIANLSWAPQSHLTSHGGDWVGVCGGRGIWGVKL